MTCKNYQIYLKYSKIFWILLAVFLIIPIFKANANTINNTQFFNNFDVDEFCNEILGASVNIVNCDEFFNLIDNSTASVDYAPSQFTYELKKPISTGFNNQYSFGVAAYDNFGNFISPSSACCNLQNLFTNVGEIWTRGFSTNTALEGYFTVHFWATGDGSGNFSLDRIQVTRFIENNVAIFINPGFSFDFSASDLSNYNTRINNIDVFSSAGSATTTDIDFVFTYNIDLTEISSSNRPDAICLQLYPSGTSSLSPLQQCSLILPLSEGISTTTISFTDLDNGSYAGQSYFFTQTTPSNIAIFPGAALSFTTADGITSNFSKTFDEPETASAAQCTWLRPDRCIIVAFQWAFFPSSETFEQWQGLGDRIINNAPFGYVLSVFDFFRNVSEEVTASEEMIDLENTALQDEIFTPLRNIMIIIIGIIAILFLYNRGKNIVL